MPDAPAAWDKITIYQVLTHTSGIPSFTGFPDYHANEVKPYTPEQLVAWFKDKPLEFQPGTDWRYSNSGYVLLGYLIEKISGRSYAQFVRSNIFDPLAMKDTGYDSFTEIVPHRAMGYLNGPTGLQNAPYIDMSIPLSAGALYSTTHDLAEVGAGAIWRKAAECDRTEEDDYAFQTGLRVRADDPEITGRTSDDHARRRHRRL